VVTAAERRFSEALAAGDGTKMITTILDLEYAIHDWSADTEEDQGTSQARAVLRGLIARLGGIVTEGLRDPAERLRPAVGPLLDLRSALRADRRYAEADTIRAALTAGGVQISDDADGTRWSPPVSSRRPGPA
jgi:cysteinyl-tRNA synthetase